MEPLIFIVVIGLFIALAIWGMIANRKRREAIAMLAHRLGLNYSTEHDYHLAERYAFLDKLAQGSDRYAFNILFGTYKGHRVQAFDYHYETYSRDNKGNRQTHHHYLSFFVLALPKSFPELTISKEGIFSKLAQSFGYDDIDFESHEFSRKFCVRSADKKFAYDVCHTRMMEFLLVNDDLEIEIEQSVLAFGFGGCMDLEQIEPNLERLVQARSLLPEYLFS